jgi:hypothetical protein
VSDNAAARLLRRGMVAHGGMCANCTATAFLKSTPAIMAGIQAHGTAILLSPYSQAGFAAMLVAGNADATSDEIDWSRVVDNWELPMLKRKQP